MLSAVSFGVLQGPLKDYLEEFTRSICPRQHIRRPKIVILGTIMAVVRKLQMSAHW